MLLINKPKGPTSHDIVDEIRKITGIRKVGHAGTLDPFAEGLLIVLVGRDETKQQSKFMGMDKEYEATFVLGEERDTGDLTGKPIKSGDAPVPPKPHSGPLGQALWFLRGTGAPPSCNDIKKALKGFTGEIEQVPSTYSAKKIKGKKAYELAREGKEVKLKPKRITIYELELVDYNYPELKIRARVSSGTYIRALARDIGRELGAGAYVKELKRTGIGEYKLKDAVTLDELKKS